MGIIEDYTKLIEIDSLYVLGYYRRAEAYYATKKYSEALRDCNRIIEIDSNLKEIYVLKGKINFETGYYDEALNDINKAIKKGSVSEELYLLKAEIKLKKKKTKNLQFHLNILMHLCHWLRYLHVTKIESSQ